MDEDTRNFYQTMGYNGPLLQPDSVSFSADDPEEVASERPLLGEAEVAELRRRFDENPEEILQYFRDTWSDDVTEEEIWAAIEEAHLAMRRPDDAAVSFGATFNFWRQQQLPDNFTFPGMTDEIPIEPGGKKFETIGDALGWVLFAGPQFLGDKIQQITRAPFRWHDHADTNFVYDLPAPAADGSLRVALFSDFGTGLYHSLYIAKQLVEGDFPVVIHLGDVYYAGRRSEFYANFEGPLNPMLDKTALYTMNANHEMLSGGFPYFDYIDRRRLGRPHQKQEGSYFALRSAKAQIVAIDTAYHEVGRHSDPKLQSWLANVLREGRDSGRTNILLSPDDPYTLGSRGGRPLLTEDLADVVLRDRLVDLWFWGNTHYCALYNRTNRFPFVGSCIGHGGYPYTKVRASRRSPAPRLFLETTARFPAWTDTRQDRGNNGYCVMHLHEDGSIELDYIDWMSNMRCEAPFRPDPVGGLQLNGPVVIHPEPEAP